MREDKSDSLECGLLLAVGIIVIAVGTDLTGGLLSFLYGEWPYICIGLVVLAFAGIYMIVDSNFSHILFNFQKDIEKKLAVYEEKLSRLQSDRREMRDNIDFMRRSFGEHWDLCKKTIDKIDKLLEQKTPVIIEAPQPQQQVEQNVHEAIQEVVGGAI